ncbi:MAG: alanine dehydrogenase [Bacteroidales bacterium]|nr:alanine dehydrogenase [Bacteroidales bacterium]
MTIVDAKTKKSIKTMPQKVKLQKNNNTLSIGIPKETSVDEKRVPLTPDDIIAIKNAGFEVLLEKGAGLKSNFTDLEYSEAGAKIVNNREKIYKEAFIIVKISPLTLEEIDLISPEKIVFSALNLSTQSSLRLQKLQEKKITAIAYELYNDELDFNPFLHVIGQINGSSAIMIASELLSNSTGGKGVMLGGLTGMPPTEIVVLGTSISAEYAIRIALGLGATVKVFDNSMLNFIKFHNTFGQHLFTSTITYSHLKKAVATADVIINTLDKKPGKSFLITEEMLFLMKEGSVIIDLKIDAGSIVETSEITTFDNPTFIKHGVIHYCVPNLASRVAQTSSTAISNLLSNILLKILEQGSIIPLLQFEYELRNATYLFKGISTNRLVSNTLNLNYTDINLIIHVF